MEGFDTPNTAQMETVARDYSSPVVDWARKPGEYSDESTNGYAFWATLASGTRVLVGRYGAVLREEMAPILDYGDDPTAIYSAPLPWHDSDVDPSDWRPEAEHGFCTSVLMIEYAMMHAPDSATADRISDLYSRLSEMAL